eukprot:SAG31_NODE_2213_length_6174_cov_4.236214_3_plen_87_part_00
MQSAETAHTRAAVRSASKFIDTAYYYSVLHVYYSRSSTKFRDMMRVDLNLAAAGSIVRISPGRRHQHWCGRVYKGVRLSPRELPAR